MSVLTVAVFDPARESAGPPLFDVKGRSLALALQAEAWLRQNLSERPTIASLCAAIGACERTLHEAFREHLDATPKAYLKILRLNAVRHDLLEGARGRRVTDVALDYGFLHFGWFSQDYRRLFGESPSQTLRRVRVGSGAVSRLGSRHCHRPRRVLDACQEDGERQRDRKPSTGSVLRGSSLRSGK